MIGHSSRRLVGSIKTWWSFRENIAEDKSTAIAFLDLFVKSRLDLPQIFRA